MEGGFRVRCKGANFVICRCNKCQPNNNRAKTIDARCLSEDRYFIEIKNRLLQNRTHSIMDNWSWELKTTLQQAAGNALAIAVQKKPSKA
jgi:hypothetical protein